MDYKTLGLLLSGEGLRLERVPIGLAQWIGHDWRNMQAFGWHRTCVLYVCTVIEIGIAMGYRYRYIDCYGGLLASKEYCPSPRTAELACHSSTAAEQHVGRYR